MSLRNLNEATDETIFEFQAAAEDRYWEAISLMTNGHLAGGVYLIGYVAEMLLKSAYFALCGAKLTQQVAPLLAPAWTVGVAYFPGSFSLSNRDYHNLDFWARLLREERRRRGVSLLWHLDAEYLMHTRRLYMTWWVEMRYRRAQATLQDAEDALGSCQLAQKILHHFVNTLKEVSMPRGRIVPVEDLDYSQFLTRLKREWEHPDSAAAEPVIIETVSSLRPQQTPTQLYVIWSDWRDLPPRRRSEMIMDVYEAVRGRPYALNVTLALGLTPEEAKQMGIRYETEAAA